MGQEAPPQAEVLGALVDVRRAVDVRFGREAGQGLHRMEGHTRRKPKRQHPQLETLVVALREWETLPPPVRPGPPGEREGGCDSSSPATRG